MVAEHLAGVATEENLSAHLKRSKPQAVISAVCPRFVVALYAAHYPPAYGGMRRQARDEETAQELLEDALALEDIHKSHLAISEGVYGDDRR
jgi:hypothetical protein